MTASGVFAALMLSCSLLSSQEAKPSVPAAEIRKLLDQGDPNAALELARKTAAAGDDSAPLHELLGEIAFRRGDIATAETEFKKALRMDGNLAMGWLGLGRVFRAASMYKSARISFAKARSLDPANPEIDYAWTTTLQGAARVEAYQARFEWAQHGGDPAAIDASRAALEREKLFAKHKLFHLTSGDAPASIAFVLLLDGPKRLRGFGLPVSVNGAKPVTLLLDTGASGILINRKAAERAGLTKIMDTKFGGIGDSGERTGYLALADHVRVGAVEFQDCPVDVSDRKSVADEDGLIGTDVFSHFLVVLDFEKHVMRLEPLPDRPAEAGARADAPADRFIATEMKSYAPVFRFGHQLMIPTRVSGSPPMLFVIDTGATDALISPAAAKLVTKVHGEEYVTMKGVSGKVNNVYRADQAVLEFAGFRQKNLDMISIDLGGISKSTGTEVSGFLGLPVLTYFTLSIDYRDGLVQFEYHAPR